VDLSPTNGLEAVGVFSVSGVGMLLFFTVSCEAGRGGVPAVVDS
jgi:hypothetical protein